MASRALVVLCVLLLPAVLSQTFNCQWAVPNQPNLIYDISLLYRNSAQGDYIGADSTYRYYMNLCGISNAGGTCTQEGGLMCQYYQGQYVAMIANFTKSPPVYSLLSGANPSGGVVLTYTNGDTCTDGSGNPRTAIIQLTCNPNAALPNSMNVYELTGYPCNYYVSMTSPNACPVDTTNVPPPTTSGQLIQAATQPNAWSYWTITTLTPTNLFELQVNTMQTSAQGYLELYVRYGAMPTEQSYDRADLSTKPSHQVVIRVTDSTNRLLYGTYYIGIKAIGSVAIDYQLKSYTFTCAGNCSMHGQCVPNPDSGYNMCQCDVGYQSNFIDCSAPVITASTGKDYSGRIVNANWAYYRFEQNDANAYQFVMELTRSKNDSGQALPTLMVKQGDWPTYSNNDGIDQDFFTPDSQWSLTLMPPVLTTGYYIVAVVGYQDTVFDYVFRANLYDCPNGCSNHGYCNPSNHSCTCDENYGNLDCSLLEIPLNPNVPIPIIIFPYDIAYYAIDTTLQLADAHIDMLIQVTRDDPSGTYYPRLLINPGVLGIPTITNFVLSSPLPLSPNATLRVPAGLLEDYPPVTGNYSTWYIGISSYAPDFLKVHLLLTYEGYCPNDCSQNGDCVVDSTYNVYCVCNEGWFGGACDVTVAEMEANGSDDVETGVAVALVIVFMALGVVAGILVKRAFPNFLAASSTQSYAPTAQRATYSAMSEESHV
jgi:hypothetical protein